MRHLGGAQGARAPPPIFLHRLPSLSLDPVSEQVQDNTKALLSLTLVVNSIEKKMSSFFETSASTFPPQNTIPDSQAPLSYSAAVTEGAQVELHLPNPREATYRPQMRRDAFTVDSNDRYSNLLVFGLLMETKEKVGNILTYLTGITIGVRDLFRIGRFKKEAEHTSRPVLVKLSSAWDRKVVLLYKRKFKNYHISRLFLREDLAPELRKRPVHPQSKPQEIFHGTAQHSSGPVTSQGTPRHSSGPVTSQGTPQQSSSPVNSVPASSNVPVCLQQSSRNAGLPSTSPILSNLLTLTTPHGSREGTPSS